MNANDLIRSGLALIRIPLGQKGPVTPEWNLPENCIRDSAKAKLLSGSNIGLAHAYCTPSPSCAMDIDNYKHARLWLASQRIDLKAFLYAPDAVVIHSGKNQSLKLIYRLPLGTPPLESKKIVGPDGKSALELRCAGKDGRTFQDLLPPSLHPDGYQYRWVGKGSPLLIPEIPPPFLETWHQQIVNGCRVAHRGNADILPKNSRAETPREVATIQAALNHISADCPYETWRNIVWAIQSTGWTCAEDMALSWSQSAPHRFDEDAFWLVANSYTPGLPDGITVGTIYHHARKGGWNG